MPPVVGELTEIRAGDLAFTVPEAGQLMTRHGITLTADSLECLTRRTEGWAAGLRLAAISMGTHPDPDQFIEELITDDSAVTGYLVAEVLNPQPTAVRELLLSTSILEHVSGEAASELTGNERAGRMLSALASANAFVQPAGSGWYRYHALFAEVLRLKLKREDPERIAPLHRRAARWYERNGQLTDAVRHAAQAGDWQLAASIVIDALAIGEIIEPRGSPSLGDEFAGMPHGRAWTGPQPHLVSAAVALSAGRHASSAAALDAAEAILERLPADQETAGRLAGAMIRLTAALRGGDLTVAAAAAARAETLASSSRAESSPGIRKSGHACCPAAELSSCGQAISTRRPVSSRRGWPPRPLPAGRANQRTAWGIWRWQRLCAAGWAARQQWPLRRLRPSPPTSSGRPSRTLAPRRWPHWPGYTWDTVSCARRTAGSSRRTPPLA